MTRVRLGARAAGLAVYLLGLAALAAYLLPGLSFPSAHWPFWDVHVYWWGGRQAYSGAPLYASGARYSFTYPPFAALVFGIFASAPEGLLAAFLTAASIVALTVLCWLSLRAAGVRPRPGTVFAVTALALLTVPVAYTLHLGEINLILAAMVAADLLRRHDGGRWQGIATGLAAGVKMTPLIFLAYLAVTGRVRAAVTAAGAFIATVTVGFILLPGNSRSFWLDRIFLDENRIGDPANPSNQSWSGVVSRLAGNLEAAHGWWLAAVAVTGLAGLAIASWAHRRGLVLAGVTCCGLTGLLISPISWTHHWVWDVPLLIMLAAGACRVRAGGACGVRAAECARATGACRLRSLGYALAAVAAAAVFSGMISMPWLGPHPILAGQWQDDLYVLAGLAVLAATAVGLALGARRPGYPPPRPAAPSSPETGEDPGSANTFIWPGT
ncbi:MAG: glycosyltransferase 87 family protein [Streptosporangiaceae bacterium]